MPTIRDVARRAGVAPITVSRVINNDSYVSNETRRRVELAIAELDYIPNALGPSLRSKQTNTLALVLSNITNPFWTTVVHDLVDIVSKNGNLLLNLGPKPDGTIPDEASNILPGLGEWLNANGETIYGARRWHTFGEGSTTVGERHLREREDKPLSADDIRFTAKGNALYAICLGSPGESVTIRSIGSGSPISADRIDHIQMLGSDDPLSWTQSGDGLQVKTPSQKPCDHAFTFKVALKG